MLLLWAPAGCSKMIAVAFQHGLSLGALVVQRAVVADVCVEIDELAGSPANYLLLLVFDANQRLQAVPFVVMQPGC